MKYHITDITWDLDYYVDENELDLPHDIIVELEQEVLESDLDIEEELAGKVSDTIGFCMFQFNYEPIQEPSEQKPNSQQK